MRLRGKGIGRAPGEASIRDSNPVLVRLITGIVFACSLAFLSGCATSQARLVWRVRDLVHVPSSTVRFVDGKKQVLATISKVTMQKLLLSHLRITRAAGVPAELVIVDGKEPNAFAGMLKGMPTIGVNLAMLRLIGDDIDEFACLVGHEAAHIARGHAEAGRTRGNTLQGIGTLVGLGLGAAGVPAAGTIAGLGMDLVETVYSREDEREADAVGVGYAMSAGYDPYGAVRIHEKLLKASGGSMLPFLSSHPSGEERIENLKAIIQAKKSQQ